MENLLNINSTISESELLFAMNELTDKQKADFALRLGEGEDQTYELMLLDKIITLLKKTYPLSGDDKEMSKLANDLSKLQPEIKKMINI